MKVKLPLPKSPTVKSPAVVKSESVRFMMPELPAISPMAVTAPVASTTLVSMVSVPWDPEASPTAKLVPLSNSRCAPELM